MNRKNIIDKIFRDKLKNATATPPADMWDKIRYHRHNRPAPSNMFNGWSMLFWLFVAFFSVSLGGSFISQDHTNLHQTSEPASVNNKQTASDEFIGLKSYNGNNDENTDLHSSESVSGSAQLLNINFSHESGVEDGEGSDEKNTSQTTEDKDAAPEQAFSASKSESTKQPALSPVQSINRETTLHSNVGNTIQEKYQSNRSPSPFDTETSFTYSPDTWYVSLTGGMNFSKNTGHYQAEQISGGTQSAHSFEMQDGYAFGIKAGKYLGSGFFIESGLGYQYTSVNEYYSKEYEAVSTRIDTAFDGQIIIPDREPRPHIETDTVEIREQKSISDKASANVHYFNVPVRAGYQYQGTLYNIEIFAGGRSGIFNRPEQQLSGDRSSKPQFANGIWQESSYVLTWEWNAGLRGEYYISRHYSILAGINAYLPMNRNSGDGIDFQVNTEQLLLTPHVQLRYRF